MNKKPKICHIGGGHSLHVNDIVIELSKLGFPQCLISYMPISKNITPKHIPRYFYPFRTFNKSSWSDKKLLTFLKKVYAKEKPDIIMGHSLAYSCVALWLSNVLGYKTCIIPWSVHTIIKQTKKSKYYETKCVGSVDYFLHGMPEVFEIFQKFYRNLPKHKYILFRPLVDLKPFKQVRQISSVPRILLIRPMSRFYRQDLLIRSLPALIKKNKNLKCTLIIGQRPQDGMRYFNLMKQLARKIGVYDYCKWIDRKLTRPELYKLIKDHNIIYAIATHDSGFSGVSLQAIYSGAITLIQDTFTNKQLLKHDINCLKTKIDLFDIHNNLDYAIENIVELQSRFIKNNRKYDMYGKENCMKNLLKCFEKMYGN